MGLPPGNWCLSLFKNSCLSLISPLISPAARAEKEQDDARDEGDEGGEEYAKVDDGGESHGSLPNGGRPRLVLPPECQMPSGSAGDFAEKRL